MWEFPSSAAFISSNGFLILWLLGVSVICGIAWLHVYFSIKNNTKESMGEFLKNIGIGAFTLLLVSFVSYSLISEYNQVKQCRNLDLNAVKGIRVTKMASEKSSGSQIIRINDTNKIQEGLKTLRTADSYDRRKKHFVYGYRIEMILEQNQIGPISLYYFSETDTSQKANAVILYCGEDSDDIATTDNVYYSSDFGNWLRENIEPEFRKLQ